MVKLPEKDIYMRQASRKLVSSIQRLIRNIMRAVESSALALVSALALALDRIALVSVLILALDCTTNIISTGQIF